MKKIINKGVKDENINLLYDVTTCLADKLEKALPEDEYIGLCKKVYSYLNGGHFNREFADLAISKMYYEDKDGKHSAPYLTEEKIKTIYNTRKSVISPYNYEDFRVALNMIISDNHNLFTKWFPDSDDLLLYYVEATVNWLNDEDNPFGENKVWGYFKGK